MAFGRFKGRRFTIRDSSTELTKTHRRCYPTQHREVNTCSRSTAELLHIMLSSGLAASLRGGLRISPTSPLFLKNSTAAASRRALPASLIAISLPPCRPLTSSTKLCARISPTSRKSQLPDLKRSHLAASRSATAEQQREVEAALLYSHLAPVPSDVGQPSIPRALLFLFGFSALSFAGAAYYSLMDTQHVAAQLRGSRDVFANISSYFVGSDATQESEVWGAGVTQKQLMVAKKQESAMRLGLRMQHLIGWCDQLQLPVGVTEVIGRVYLITAQKYLDLLPSQQVVVPVVAINTLVFGLWTVASARRGGAMWRWMTTNFVHRPSANRMRTMLTSVFSHQTLLHYVFNNVALWSIGGSALMVAAHRSTNSAENIPEASPTPQFLAFFVTAGLFAATVSHLVAGIRFKRISLRHGIDVARATVGRHASLGSSGAVYAALVMSACAFPDAKLGIIFLPFVSVPIGVGLAGIVAVDVAGVLFRWKMFDHWAHLGGAAFGALYWYAGGVDVWRQLKSWLAQSFRLHDDTRQIRYRWQ